MAIMESGDEPYIEMKDVILCRSGVQLYRRNEILGLGIGEPPIEKEVYAVYRKPEAVRANPEKFAMLTITREHPPVFLNRKNWKRYAEGYTAKEVSVVQLDDGEIGLKTSLVFATEDVYQHYLNGNREVSVGYTSRNRWTDPSESSEYDAIMEEILEVNHLAVTAKGRGGSRVAIIDSMIGGMKMFKTGIFALLGKKGKTNDSATIPFSKTVFDTYEKSKDLEGAELEAAIGRVTDSLVVLKDSETKKLLVDTVSDVFTGREHTDANKEGVAGILDSLFVKAEEESLKGMTDALPEDKKPEEKVTDADKEKADKEAEEKEKAEKMKDTDGKGSGTNNISDSDIKKMIDDGMKKIQDSVVSTVNTAVATALGVKPAKTEQKVAQQDSVTDSETDPTFNIHDYI